MTGKCVKFLKRRNNFKKRNENEMRKSGLSNFRNEKN